jgi:hypothetical protein
VRGYLVAVGEQEYFATLEDRGIFEANSDREKREHHVERLAESTLLSDLANERNCSSTCTVR